MQWFAVAIGAGLGACFRAWLARFNGYLSDSIAFNWVPLGTLIANVLGGLLIGIAIVVFQVYGNILHPNIRMMVVTGFLGGLTTFSTFSAEVFGLLNDGRLMAGFGLAVTHLLLTLCATAIGFYFSNAILGQ